MLDSEPVLRHGAAVEAERRKTGDREAIARAVALHARAIIVARNDPVAALAMLEAAWVEFGDLEQTEAGVDLMLAFVRSYRGIADNVHALEWIDRLLPIAERLGSLPKVARGILGRGISLAVSGRPREGIILLRGAHQLALANDLRDDIELGSRILLTFYEQWGDPAAGLALGREGLDIGRRLGSVAYSFQMVGNSAICALRVGEWDWATALLEEWLETRDGRDLLDGVPHRSRAFRRLPRPRHRRGYRGGGRLREGVTDPQFESYELWARAVTSLAKGELTGAISHAERAAQITDYFAPLAIPLAARAALWAADAATARRLLDNPRLALYSGPALDTDRTCIRAGIAALEGNAAEAVALYRDAMRAYRGLSLDFDAALAGLDVATLIGPTDRTSPEIAEWIDAARATLERLGAAPLLDRLDTALAVPDRTAQQRTGQAGKAPASAPR